MVNFVVEDLLPFFGKETVPSMLSQDSPCPSFQLGGAGRVGKYVVSADLEVNICVRLTLRVTAFFYMVACYTKSRRLWKVPWYSREKELTDIYKRVIPP